MSNIVAPKVNVLLTNGEQHTVKLNWKAQKQYGRTARARNWPSVDKAGELSIEFMTWYIMTQVDQVLDCAYEEFEDLVEWMESVEEEVTEGHEDYPTNLATGKEI